MIERVTGGQFVCDETHHSLKTKPTLKNPLVDSGDVGTSQRPSPPRGARGRGQ